MEAIVGLLMGLFFPVLVITMVVSHRRDKTAWKAIAKRFDLSCRADESLRIWGTNREVELDFRTEIRGSGKNRTMWTIGTAALPGTTVPKGTMIRKEGLLSKAGKLVGRDDIQLGMPELDARLLVDGDDPAAIHAWAGRGDVARALYDLSELDWNLQIDEFQVTLERRGVPSDVEAMTETLQTLIGATRALSGRGYGALLYSDDW